MKSVKKSVIIVSLLLAISLFMAGCKAPGGESKVGEKPVVLATTTMAYDLVKTIGADEVDAQGLMAAGVDPHLYTPTAKDVQRFADADIVVYSGLHLEGKLEDIFEDISNDGKTVVNLTSDIPKSDLIEWEDESGPVDPHFWWDPVLWKEAAKKLTNSLSEAYPEKAEIFKGNLDAYLIELDELNAWATAQVESIPEDSRVLVTAHDAFSYFARRYGFEVKGVQGISTEAEAGAGDINELADFIAERKIKAIFVETSVPQKTIKALQEAVLAKGFDVVIGGELFSDSLGDIGTDSENYIGAVKANVNTIVEALK